MEDQELEIEPYSMSRTNEGKQQARSRLIMDVSANLLPVMAQFPDAVDWKKNLNDMGDAVNVPGLGDRFHPDKAAEALGRQMEAEAELQARYSSASGGDQGQGGGFAPKQPPGAKNRGAQPPKVGGGVEKAATAGAGR
jgi:hypothetical protein